MDTLRLMKTFVRVVELGSFTSAAAELGVSQSSISKQIAMLENHLGAKLLSRTTRQLHITDNGKDYYERCQVILRDILEAESSIAGTHSTVAGPIRVCVPDTLGRLKLLPILWEFMEQYPDIELDILLDDRRTDIVKEGIDLSIRSGQSLDPTLITRKLCKIPRVLVASPKYLQKSGKPTNLQSLQLHQCIVYSLAESGKAWTFEGGASIKVSGRTRVSSPEAALLAASNHMGIALSPIWLAQSALNSGSLDIIDVGILPTSFEVHAVFPARRFIPTRVRKLVDHLKQRIND